MFKSKMLVLAFATIVTSQSSWAQNATGAILSTLSEKPEILELQKIVGWNGASIKYVQENPMTMVDTVYKNAGMLDFKSRVLASNLTKMSCDGNFEIKLDRRNMQYIEISSINVCLDEQNNVVAHAFGRGALTDKEMKDSIKKIKKSHEAEPTTCFPSGPLSTLEEDVSRSLERVKYSCDPKDLVTGHYVVGAGTNVYVNHLQGTAKIGITPVAPPFKESIQSVILKKEDGKDVFSAKSENVVESFQLAGSSGILTRRYTKNGKETAVIFKCDIEQK